jgi:hypothetical protein
MPQTKRQLHHTAQTSTKQTLRATAVWHQCDSGAQSSKYIGKTSRFGIPPKLELQTVAHHAEQHQAPLGEESKYRAQWAFSSPDCKY